MTSRNISRPGQTSSNNMLYRNGDSLENAKHNDIQPSGNPSEKSDCFITDMLGEPFEETRYSQFYDLDDALVEQSAISAENRLLDNPIECNVDPDGFIVPCSRGSTITDIRKRKHPFQGFSYIIKDITIGIYPLIFFFQNLNLNFVILRNLHEGV